MEDFANPAKPLDSEDYWITAKCPKAMAALHRAFAQAKWDVLTTTIDAQISEVKWMTDCKGTFLSLA